MIIALIVIKFSESQPSLPDRIVLPDGATAKALTRADTWFAVVTDDDRILIYKPATGTQLQEI